jgi:multiple sugar transport system substrate-binding protein
MKKLIRFISLALTVLVMVMIISACSNTAAEKSSKDKPADSGKKVTISTYFIANDWFEEGNALVEKFMDENPNIVVENIPVANDSASFLKTRAASNDLPDITAIDINELGWSIVNAGMMMDLSDLEVAKHINDTNKKFYTAENGDLFGITFGFATTFMYYNKAIFADAGFPNAPSNFDELIDACKAINAKGITPVGLAGMHTTINAIPLDGIIGNIFGEKMGIGGYEAAVANGTFDLTGEDGIKVMNRLYEFSRFFQKGVAGTDEIPVNDLFVQEKVAMILGGNWTANYTEPLGDKLGIIIPPFNDAGKKPWVVTVPETAVGISNTNKDKDIVNAKVKFFEWFWLPQNYKAMQHTRGNIPSIDNAVDVKILPQILEVLPAVQAAPAVTMNFAVYSAQAYDALQKSLQELYIDTMTPEVAAKTITDAIKTYPLKK